jgi:hypothetical protein
MMLRVHVIAQYEVPKIIDHRSREAKRLNPVGIHTQSSNSAKAPL